MSNKLNALELASKICTRSKFEAGRLGSTTASIVEAAMMSVCIETIHEVAQPIADERDEFRDALQSMFNTFEGLERLHPVVVCNARAILAKYPKP
jgi:hypothetical protein